MSARGEDFPWARVMELGLGVLRLAPAAFWTATLREIAAAFPSRTATPMDRASLDNLITQYPD